MLDRSKLLGQLNRVGQNIFQSFAKEQDIARSLWNELKYDEQLSKKVHQKKYSLLLPRWNGALGFSKKIDRAVSEYTVLSVDGSQIYYDKHQGPQCYLINVGSIVLDYGKNKSSVFLDSEPHIFFLSDQKDSSGSAEFINAQREEYEFERSLQLSLEWDKNIKNKRFLTLFDGSLIFFHLDSQSEEQRDVFLEKYFNILRKFYEDKILSAGYMSFPRTKEIINILRLALSQFDEKILEENDFLSQLTDMDIASFYLEPGYRSTIFKSLAPISYLYPKELKPYFCYMNVGKEIVRLEFPAWLAEDELLVDELCMLTYDQSQKGYGYPVALFEAHEQAVIKGNEREFFYAILHKKMEQNMSFSYRRSFKSMKKDGAPI